LTIGANESVDRHVRGVALLLASVKPENVDEAIQLLKAAYTHAPSDQRDTIATDLAAALLARGRWVGTPKQVNETDDANQKRAMQEKHDRDQTALQLASGVWQRQHTPEAAWNRALAFEALGADADALQAWDDYLKLDSSSEWAKEAAKHRTLLVEDLPPTR
jgi:hypothetical protein